MAPKKKEKNLKRSNIITLKLTDIELAVLNEAADVTGLSRSEYVRELLEEYDVSYIFVGSKEREKYGEALNEDVLKSLGEVVFQDEVYSTYILKVNK